MRTLTRLAYITLLFSLGASSAFADQASSRAGVQNKLWKEYCTEFHDPDANNKWTACKDASDPTKPAPAGPIKNGDIDIEGVLFKDTLDLTDQNVSASVTAVMRNLFNPTVQEKNPDNTLNTSLTRERILLQQHISAARSIAYHTVSDIISRRQSIPPSTSEQLIAAGIATGAPGNGPGSPGSGPVSSPPIDGSSPSGTAGAPGGTPSTPSAVSSGTGGAKFDWAMGDSISNGVQAAGGLGGGACPDNTHTFKTNPVECPQSGVDSKGNPIGPSFYNCNPARNSVGSTCVSRPTSNILGKIIPLYAGDIKGKKLVFSSGLSNEQSACKNGASSSLQKQLQALANAGAAYVVVLGTYKGMIKKDKKYVPGSVRTDLAVLNDCVKNEVTAFKSAGHPNFGYIDGYDNAGVPEASNDTIHPTDKKAYLAIAEAKLAELIAGGNAPAAAAAPPAADPTAPAEAPAPATPGGVRPECEFTADTSNPQSVDNYISALFFQEGGKWTNRTFPGRNSKNELIYPNYLGGFQMGEQVLGANNQKCVVVDCDSNNNNYGADPDPKGCNAKDMHAYKDRFEAAKGMLGSAGAEAAITTAMLQAERWTGTCGGVSGIKSSVDYMNCPKAQVVSLLNFNMPLALPTNMACGTGQPPPAAKACTIYDGVELTPSGLRGAGHMLGFGGVNKWLCNPGTSATDAFGTSANGRIRAMNGYFTKASDPQCSGVRSFSGKLPGSGSLVSRDRPGDIAAPADPTMPLGPPKLVPEVVREIRQKAGVPEEKIAQDPSYNEIMLAMTKEKFLNPSYYSDITGDSGALAQEQAMLESYIILQWKDIHQMQEQINALLAARASLKYNKERRSERMESLDLK